MEAETRIVAPRRVSLAAAWPSPAAGTLAAVLLAGCAGDALPAGRRGGAGDRPETPAEAIPVAVSVPPAAWLVERVGGERVAVTALLPPGRSPHAWEPSPRELAALGRARLVVVVGHTTLPFEERLLAAARRGGEPSVVAMTEGIALLPGADGDHHDGADEGAGHGVDVGGYPGPPIESDTDPHVWLDPEVMAATAERVAAALAAIDPEHAAEYRDRRDRLRAEIDALDREIRATLAGVTERRFLAYHPAWGYFAARYGLVQEAVESEGKEPGPRRLVERMESARARGARVVFVQRAVSGRGARVLAEEIGAEVVVLDPLASDWPDNLRRVAAAMAAALGAEAPGASAP
jgi:zinc transport system substrate-binding protein